ncbi:MAG: hypothetical protein VXW32_03145 [Myxococcota bacterium]|nr:hypothetical protein [Myxococcota bacterium]
MNAKAAFQRFLLSRWLVPVAVLLPLLLQVQGLWFGLAADDFLQHAKLVGGVGYAAQEQVLPDYFNGNPVFELFEFFPRDPVHFDRMVDAGILPWWAESGASAAFFRPVSAVTHVFDTAVFGDAFWLHHLHSFVWAGLGIGLVSGLYRKVIPVPMVAAVALLGFSLEEAHTMGTVWLANRNAWVALVFGVLAIRLHIAHQRHTTLWAAVAFGAALGAGEMGVCAGAYLVSWELWKREGSVLSRMGRLLPYGVVFLLWCGAYIAGDFGVQGSGLYLDPLQSSEAFLQQLPGKLGVLIVGQALQVPPEIWLALPYSADVGFSLGAGLLLVVGGFLLWPWLRVDRSRLFWATGMFLCLIPVSGGFPMKRLLMFCGLGFFPLLADFVGVLWREGSGQRPGLWRLSAARGLFFLHLVLGVVALPADAYLSKRLFSAFEEGARSLPDDPALAEQNLILMGSFDVANAFLPMIRSEFGLVSPRGQYLLGGLSGDMVVHRIASNVLEVEYPEGLLPGRIDWMSRGPWSEFVKGDSVSTALFRATVLKDGGPTDPLRVRFEFDRNLEDPSLVWRAAEGRRLATFVPPTVGSHRVLSGRDLRDLF